MADPAPMAMAATALDLRSVASEVLFAAQFFEAIRDQPGAPSMADKTRLKALMIQIRNDVDTVTEMMASHLGVNPMIGT